MLFLTGCFHLLPAYSISILGIASVLNREKVTISKAEGKKLKPGSGSVPTVQWLLLSGFHKSSLGRGLKSYEILRLGETTSISWVKCDVSQTHRSDLIQATWKIRFSPKHIGANYYPKLITPPNDVSLGTLKN